MGSVLIWSVTVTVMVLLAGLVLLLFLYRRSGRPQKRGAVTGQAVQPEETGNSNRLVTREEPAGPTVTHNQSRLEKLVWPGMKKFDLEDCGPCTEAESVARAHPESTLAKPRRRHRAHRDVHDGPFTLPNSRFPRDIPFNRGLSAFHGLFHLSLIYRRDTELRVHWKLTLKTNTNGRKTEPLACWLGGSKDLNAESALRCFREPGKHVKVGILQSSSDVLRAQNYFMRSSSCRFYLSLHRDYATEPFRAPSARSMLAARRNSENVAPSVPFFHPRGLPDAARLAEFLLSLDTDYKSFMSFLKWQQFYNGRRRLTEEKQEFLCLS